MQMVCVCLETDEIKEEIIGNRRAEQLRKGKFKGRNNIHKMDINYILVHGHSCTSRFSVKKVCPRFRTRNRDIKIIVRCVEHKCNSPEPCRHNHVLSN